MNKLNLCNYLDLNSQNADDMNLNCIQDSSKGRDKYCASEYKLYDNISREFENYIIKRDVDAGYGIRKFNNEVSKEIKKINESSGIEGFTGKIFYTDNGMGENTVLPNECPEGFTWCSKTNSCIQVCTNCKYRDNMKSQEFNEFDKCFPNGVYDGVDTMGNIKCNCGKDNKYCSDNLLKHIELEGSFDIFSDIADYLLL